MGLNPNALIYQQPLLDPGFGTGFDFMMRSCPPPKKDMFGNFQNDSLYQEKLHNFADSYKKLNLEFNDIQEDDLENSENQKQLSKGSAGTFGAGSGKNNNALFNIEKSLGHLGLNDSFTKHDSLNKNDLVTNADKDTIQLQHQHDDHDHDHDNIESREMSPFSQKLRNSIKN